MRDGVPGSDPESGSTGIRRVYPNLGTKKSIFLTQGYLGNWEPRHTTKLHQATNLTQEIY